MNVKLELLIISVSLYLLVKINVLNVYTIVSKDIFTQKVEGCAVLMKEADFNAVFDKY